ncbi:MAG: hypothetical protein AABY88_00500 [Pseudomonadota bacterium]
MPIDKRGASVVDCRQSLGYPAAHRIFMLAKRARGFVNRVGAVQLYQASGEAFAVHRRSAFGIDKRAD